MVRAPVRPPIRKIRVLVVNYGSDHKGLGLLTWLLRYSFAHFFLAFRYWPAFSCAKTRYSRLQTCLRQETFLLDSGECHPNAATRRINEESKTGGPYEETLLSTVIHGLALCFCLRPGEPRHAFVPRARKFGGVPFPAELHREPIRPNASISCECLRPDDESGELSA